MVNHVIGVRESKETREAKKREVELIEEICNSCYDGTAPKKPYSTTWTKLLADTSGYSKYS
jgi:hypothetical protein